MYKLTSIDYLYIQRVNASSVLSCSIEWQLLCVKGAKFTQKIRAPSYVPSLCIYFYVARVERVAPVERVEMDPLPPKVERGVDPLETFTCDSTGPFPARGGL